MASLVQFIASAARCSRYAVRQLRYSWSRRNLAERDVITIGLIAAAVFLIVDQTKAGSHFLRFVADNPDYDIDDLLIGVLTLGVGALVFSIRRWRELQHAIGTRELAEDKAARAAALLQDALDSISEGFVIYDRDGRLVLMNDTYRRLFPHRAKLMVPGVRFEDLLRQLMTEGEFPEAIGQEEEWFAGRVEQHHNAHGETERELADGRWVLVSERRMRNGGIAGLRVDITELKRVQSALREGEKRLRDFVELSSDWFWEQDADLRFIWGSGIPALQELTTESFIGKTRREFADLAGEMDILQWTSHMADLEARRSFHDFRYQRTGVDGRVRHLSASGKPMFDASGVFVGYRGTGNDITEMVEAERELRKSRDAAEAASRAKSEFLATMSHELRTPLHAIIGFSELISDETFGHVSPKYMECARDIRESGMHLLDLINEALDLSTLDADRYQVREERVSLASIVDSCAKMLDSTVRQKQVRFERDSRLDAVILWADRRALKQVILNVLDNAVKFSKQAGVVSVDTRLVSSGNLAMTITDTGIGIEPAKLEHVFEPFYQADATASRRYGGVGLGLAICRRLLALHGGSIELESAVGRGTTVTIALPASRVIKHVAAVS